MQQSSRRDFIKLGSAASTVSIVGFAGCTSGGDSEDYPSESITIIPPFPEGSLTDALARQMGSVITDEYDVDHVVEPMGGAASLRGTGELFNRDPDGYTFGMPYIPSAPFAALINDPGWDMRDLTGLLDMGKYTLVVVANPEENFEGFEDMRERYNNGEYNTLGGIAIGHAGHIAAEYIKEDIGWDWNNLVTYDGSNDAMRGIRASEVPAAVIAHPGTAQQHNEGNLEILASLGSEPEPALPSEVSTWSDLGYDNLDHITQVSFTTFGPPDIDSDRRQEVIDLLTTATESEDVKGWGEDYGMQIEPRTSGDDLDQELDRVMTEVPETINFDDLTS